MFSTRVVFQVDFVLLPKIRSATAKCRATTSKPDPIDQFTRLHCYELKILSCNKVKNKWKVPKITGLNRVVIGTMETTEVEQ